MEFAVEYRNVWNDVTVTPWREFADIGRHPTPLAAYNALCQDLGCIVTVTGFVDAPEWGQIRTGRAYGDYTLLCHPQDQNIQYRIVNPNGPAPIRTPRPRDAETTTPRRAIRRRNHQQRS